MEEIVYDLELIEKIDKVNGFKVFLNETDFYYTRQNETGKSVPVEVANKRAEARAFIRENT